LLVGKARSVARWNHTPCGYAARANSDGAKLSFASSFFDQ